MPAYVYNASDELISVLSSEEKIEEKLQASGNVGISDLFEVGGVFSKEKTYKQFKEVGSVKLHPMQRKRAPGRNKLLYISIAFLLEDENTPKKWACYDWPVESNRGVIVTTLGTVVDAKKEWQDEDENYYKREMPAKFAEKLKFGDKKVKKNKK